MQLDVLIAQLERVEQFAEHVARHTSIVAPIAQLSDAIRLGQASRIAKILLTTSMTTAFANDKLRKLMLFATFWRWRRWLVVVGGEINEIDRLLKFLLRYCCWCCKPMI